MPEKGWLRRHIVTQIVTVTIVGIAGALVASQAVRNFFKAIPWAIGSFFRFLAAPVQTFRWYYWFLIAVFIIAVIRMIVNAIPRGPSEIHWRKYTRDSFFGVVWRWDYDSDGIRRGGLVAYCPQCDRIMTWNHEDWRNNTYITCVPCQKKVILEGGPEYIYDCVCREIDVKIRNGTFREVVKAGKE